MDEHVSLNHTEWECKYHVVFIPKGRQKVLYKELRRYLGEVFRRLAEQKQCRIEDGHLMPVHVHMMIATPPKHAVSQGSGYIKGKCAIRQVRVYGAREPNFVGRHFWARGFFVSTLHAGEQGGFQVHGSNGMTYNWKAWDGRPHGYEGLLVDNYQARLAMLAQ